MGNIKLQELEEDLNDVMNASDAGSINLLLTMSVALSALAEDLIKYNQLIQITDMVEATSKMEVGIDRDLSFEKTRKILKEMIKI